MAWTMALLLISSLGVLLPLVTAESEPTTCPDGKEYNNCGSRCPPTCENPEPVCTYECVPGCFCKKGTVDNGLEECVGTDKCGECSGNTTYTKCVFRCPPNIHHTVCKIACIEGCICKPNYVSQPNTKICLLPQDVPNSGSNN